MLPETRTARPPGTTPDARVVVTVVPSTSGYAAQVRDAARAIGAEFSRTDPTRTGDVADRVMVVDLTRVMAQGRLGDRVIAISQRLDLDCYEVISPDQVRARLKRALRNLVERERLRQHIGAEQQTILALNEIGYALSAEGSRANLLDTVLTQARAVLRADGGSIYLVDGDKVRFTTSQNDTIPFRASRKELPLDDTSLAGFVASNRAALNIADIQDIPESAPYRPNMSFDRETGYRTRSMLLVPMCDREGDVIGVLALVNRKPEAGVPLHSYEQVTAFSERDAGIAGSIASQAAVAIENHRLYVEIRGLFDGFVNAAISAVESRDPSTAGHSHRVAWLTTTLARDVSASDVPVFRDIRFTEQQIMELDYAAILHDFGKVGVREEVLLKAEKLFAWELRDIEYRFRLAAMQVALEDAAGRISPAEASARMRQLQRDLARVRQLNGPSGRVEEAERAELEAIAARWQVPDTGEQVLGGREVHRLGIPYGTLDEQERLEIQRHVSNSYEFLRRIPWTRGLRDIADIAHAHHEKRDGTGYPLQLTDLEIPFGAKLMTIADIYDALTAGDRPYKPAMPPEKALGILRHMAGRGKLLEEAVELFAARRSWLHIPKDYRVDRRQR
jgi:HD-GYP domain-containing protein (c-di-GMP phosphodiesterase class II)